MKKMTKTLVLALSAFLAVSAGFAYGTEKAKESKGEKLFKENCSPCHPDGGNIINPKYTLQKKHREAHGVKTAKDIIGKMRNPGPGMTKFDEKTIPEKDAMQIAEYIQKAFK